MTKVCYNHLRQTSEIGLPAEQTPEKGLLNVPSESEKTHSCHPITFRVYWPAMQICVDYNTHFVFLQRKGENAPYVTEAGLCLMQRNAASQMQRMASLRINCLLVKYWIGFVYKSGQYCPVVLTTS